MFQLDLSQKNLPIEGKGNWPNAKFYSTPVDWTTTGHEISIFRTIDHTAMFPIHIHLYPFIILG